MTVALVAARIEMRRLSRSGLLIGLVLVFAFFGLSGPVLAAHLPDMLRAAAGTEQLTISATRATPEDGIALFTQSAMQLGLVFAVATAVTALGWDARPGSSIFYRTRVRSLAAFALPRLAVVCLSVSASYLVGLLLAAVTTAATIGPLALGAVVRVGFASCLYLVMAMSVGHLVMTSSRRTASALAMSTVVMLVLPLLNSVGAAGWAPTALLTAARSDAGSIVIPAIIAALTTVVCVVVANEVCRRQGLRRDA
ncbi:hypothetical protein AB1K56_08885 [Microbacterium sp. BWR-S6Y]|uniref:hypothetical protein n=1 Tax=Microbacterium sp. BWR-S6Y TaxID=3232073 RepID=UPI0035289E2A